MLTLWTTQRTIYLDEPSGKTWDSKTPPGLTYGHRAISALPVFPYNQLRTAAQFLKEATITKQLQSSAKETETTLND